MIITYLRRWRTRRSLREHINAMGWRGLLKVLVAMAGNEGRWCTFRALQAAQVAAENDDDISAARGNVVRMPGSERR